MGVLKVQLIFATCVTLIINGIIGIQVHQFRYPLDSKWRTNTRQDVFTPQRYFLWKPQVPSVYNSPNNNPLLPATMSMYYNRYGLTPIPVMIHHPKYMYGMPQPKVNNYSYRKKKDLLNTKSKAGNYHHITVIKAVLPKPYMPLPTVPMQHAQQDLRDLRLNKQLAYYHMNTARATPKANSSRTMAHHSPAIPLIQTINAHQAISILRAHDGQNNNSRATDTTNFQCNQISRDTQFDAIVVNSYCNMLHNNGTNKREITHLEEQPKLTSTTTQPTILESFRDHVPIFTSPKPIFLPTVNGPIYFTETTTIANSNKIWNTMPRTTTTIAPPTLKRNNLQQHNFFTIEDAITAAPSQNYVFNNPYEALAHARKRKELLAKDQIEKESSVGTEANSFFTNFFDDSAETNSDFRRRPPYFSYRNEGINNNWRSKIRSKDSYADHSEYMRTTDNQWKHLTTTALSDLRIDKETTTLRPNSYDSPNAKKLYSDIGFDKATTTTLQNTYDYDFGNGKIITSTLVSKTTAIPISTLKTEESTSEKIVIESTSENPIVTTISSHNTTTKSKMKLPRFKHFFLNRTAESNTTQKTPAASLNALKNSTYASVTSAIGKKKSNKYRRQYKPKKNRIIKATTSTTSIPSTTSTTQATLTRSVNNTNKLAYRTSTSSSTASSLLSTKASRVRSERTQRTKSRDPKRQKNPKRNEKASKVTTEKPVTNKSRRRLYTSTPLTNSDLVTSASSVSTPSVAPTSFPSTRKSAFELKGKTHGFKASTKASVNEVTPNSLSGIKHISRVVTSPSSKDVGIPSLPIEIYFKSTQNFTSSM